MITLDEGQEREQSLSGVLAIRSYRDSSGLPGLRFVWPRITHAWGAMRRANASVYYQRTSDSLTGIVAAFCRSHGRRFVFSVGEDGDCLPSLPNCPTRRERALYRWGLKRADVVLAQTRWQQAALARHFDVRSILVRSAGPDPGEPAPLPRDGRPRMLWVGRLAPQKRPDLLLEVARRCPETEFDAVGAAHSGALAESFAAAASAFKNVHLHGFVPHARLGAYYDHSAGLICTSAREGFPNTFIEAWSRGRPVLTLVDPDDIVRDEGVGVVAEDAERLGEAVRRIDPRSDEWTAMARRARAYYLREHRPEGIIDAYERLLRTLVAPGDARCSR